MSKVLVTGASGFVGRHLCNTLASLGYQVIGTTRSDVSGSMPSGYDLRTISDISTDVDWGPVIRDVDFIVHLAARVHVMQDLDSDPLAAFRRVNVHGTEQLLHHEYMRNVKRFVYVSSIKVLGDETYESPFSATDTPAPLDPYGQSKLEAEQLVAEAGARVGFETTIIRPPLVYGAGVGGNFYRLMKIVDKGYPLPFGKIQNKRSLVGVENLCDLIRECLTNRAAAGERFLVSDNSDVSTPDLIGLIASAMKRPVRLLPIPVALIAFAARLLGRPAEAARLTGSLCVDIDQTLDLLGWSPPVSLSDGIGSAVSWYKEKSLDA